MKKSSGAEGFFDDGLTYLFKKTDGTLKDIRPRHIHFEVYAETKEGMESCDFRFYTVEPVVEEADQSRRLDDEESKKSTTVTAAPAGPNNLFKKKEFSDVAFFRLGYFNFLKLNTQNMLMEYEPSKWYNIDIILDFDDQRASIYVNDVAQKSASFFTQRKDKLKSGNALSIYGLSPNSGSQFRNI